MRELWLEFFNWSSSVTGQLDNVLLIPVYAPRLATLYAGEGNVPWWDVAPSPWRMREGRSCFSQNTKG
jgi:hypothetical protein